MRKIAYDERLTTVIDLIFVSLSVIATEGRLGNHTLPALLTAYFSEYFAFPLSYLPKLVTIQDQIRKTTPLMQ